MSQADKASTTRRALFAAVPALALAATPSQADHLSPRWRALANIWGKYSDQVVAIARLAERRGFSADDLTLIQVSKRGAEKTLLAYFGDWNGPRGTKYTVIYPTGGYTALVLA